MKKFTALLLALIMVLGLTACSGGSTASTGGSTSEGTTSGGNAATQTPAVDGATAAAEGNAAVAAEALANAGDPVEGGDITIYWQEFYNNYDPSLADNRNYALWFERLWSPDWALSRDKYDWSSEYVTMEHMTGQLAQSWEIADDYSSMTVTLRDDAVFQTLPASYDYYGGRTLNAEDVAWSYRRLIGIDGVEKCEAEQNWSSKIGCLESCEVVDEQTIIFHFNTNSEPAINDFMIAGVNIGGVEWDTLTPEQQTDWHYACGTGPFIVSDYVADSYMTFTKNPNYYMVDGSGNQLPYLDSVTLAVIPDTANRVSQFIAGGLDMLGWGNDVIGNSEKQQLRDAMSNSTYYEYSYVTNPCGIFLKQCHPALADRNVRIAIQKAINMEEVTTAYYGLNASELQLFGIWSQSTEWSSVDEWDDELLDEYSYDPEASRQLLADAGYPDGFEFNVTLFAMMDVDLYTLVSEYLAQVGITMTINTVSVPPEMQAIGLDTSDPRCIPGTVCLYNIAGGIENYASYGNNNNGAINDPELDALIGTMQAATTLEEQAEAARAEDLYVARQHYTVQCGPCERVNSYISGRIGGYSGERLWKNWNVTTVLTNIWVIA